MNTPAIDMALLERAVGNLPADALAGVRGEALARFGETGFPDTRQEDWKYTNLSPAVELSNEWLRDAAASPPARQADGDLQRTIDRAIEGIDACWIVIANGSVDRSSLEKLSLPGVEVTSAALRGELPAVRSEDPMSRFNAALLRDALHVRIAAGREPERPVGLLLVDDAGPAACVTQTRVVIEAEENARARFVEIHVTAGGHRQFANVVTELALAAGAQVDFVRLQERGAAHFQVGRLTVTLARQAMLNHAAFDFGGALVRNDVAVDIGGPGAVVRLHGLYLADGRQHIDNHTRIDHRVGPAISVEEYRGILSDRARCVFNGKAIVHKGADGTDARQSNRNLLLSDRAEIDTKPELEIYADDVKCSHGATVGQLDRAAMFYLQSRGIERREAAHMLTRAFAASAVDQIPVAAVRPRIEAAIDRRLASLIAGDSR